MLITYYSGSWDALEGAESWSERFNLGQLKGASVCLGTPQVFSLSSEEELAIGA